MTTLCLSEVSHAFELLFWGFGCYACAMHSLDKWQSYKTNKEVSKTTKFVNDSLRDMSDKIKKGESVDQNITFNLNVADKEQ